MPSQRPSLSLKVLIPLSALIPAPVKTTFFSLVLILKQISPNFYELISGI
jgi:hypothetical protein